MKSFDWNSDGKPDWQDDAIFFELTDKDTDNEHNTFSVSDTGGTLSTEKLGPMATFVIVVSIIMGIACLFTGSLDAFGSLLNIGGLAFLAAVWLENRHH